MAEVASAYVSLLPSAKGFGKGISNQIGGDLSSAGKSGGKRLGAGVSGGFLPSIKGLMGPVAALFAVGAIGSFFKSANAEARESQKVGALTENVIKTTGGAAKVTAGQVGDLSMAISNKTGIDDEAIQHGANLLLTFKNVRNEVGKGADIFDRATGAAADLSASGFGDLAGSSKMLGKALNDPMKGITALGRAGVTFSAGQKKQIEGFVKTGDLLGAQKIIMAEVESQVGGAAAASATAGEKLSTTWGNLKEQIGTALLPAIDTAMTAVSGFLGGIMTSFQKGGFSQVFTDLGTNITAALPGIKVRLVEWGTAFWAWIQVAGPPMLVKLGELLTSLGTWIGTTALPALSAALVKWGKAFVEWIQPMIPPMLDKAGDLLTSLGNWLLATGLPLLGTKLKQWGLAFVKWIGPMIPPILLALGKLLGRLQIWMYSVAYPAIIMQLAKWSRAFFMWVPGALVSLLGKLHGLSRAVWGWILSVALPGIRAKLFQWGLAFLGWVARVIVSLPGRLAGLLVVLTGWARGVPGKIVSALGSLGDLLRDAGRSILNGLLGGMRTKFEEIKTFVGGIGSWIADHKGPLSYDRKLLAPAGGAIMAGLNDGLEAGFADVQSNVRGLAGRLIPRVGSLDLASSADRANAVAGSGIDYDRLASAMSRVQIGLDGKNVAASVDQRLGGRLR